MLGGMFLLTQQLMHNQINFEDAAAESGGAQWLLIHFQKKKEVGMVAYCAWVHPKLAGWHLRDARTANPCPCPAPPAPE
jgi:hypothetical protein